VTKNKETNNANSENDVANKLKKANKALKTMNAHLMQTGKMASLGQLSAGIAHELKQPLTGIIGFVDDALEEVERGSPAISSLNIVKAEAERMHKIINGIRKFSRVSGTEKEPIDLNVVINDALLLLRKQLTTHNIILKTELYEKLPQAFANASQMQQVFVNMIVNSKDALESKGGGTLTIKSCLSDDGKYCEVSFKDTGCGIPKEVIEKLSEPFFTTKGPEKGTGLGTSISFSIIKDHDGIIDVTSKVGKGTIIRLTVPIAVVNG